VKAGHEIWFIDQTSTHLWSKPSKVWRPAGITYKLSLPPQRGHSITLMAALSSKPRKAIYYIDETTCKVSVIKFLKKIFTNINGEGHVLVMDRHPAHMSRDVTEFLRSRGIIGHVMPPNSCCLNPVELIWSAFKNKWSTWLLQNEVSPAAAGTEALRLLRRVPTGKLLRGVYPYYNAALDGQLV